MHSTSAARIRTWVAALIFAGAILAAGCSSMYYNAMEKLGQPKREILVKRVTQARDSQKEAAEEITSTLDQFKALTGFQGGDLEAQYNKMNDALEDSEASAREVGERIDAIEDVADALFKEWEAELDQYSNADLRRKSQTQLRDTRRRSEELVRTMRSAESKIEPVLKPMRDQVLYLKHNLNARAIGSLQNTLSDVQREVAVLVKEMNASITEADAFIREMERSS